MVKQQPKKEKPVSDFKEPAKKELILEDKAKEVERVSVKEIQEKQETAFLEDLAK